jgi:hypothetical protein
MLRLLNVQKLQLFPEDDISGLEDKMGINWQIAGLQKTSENPAAGLNKAGLASTSLDFEA